MNIRSLAKSVDSCDFSVRADNVLTTLGCVRMIDVVRLTTEQLKGARGCGKITINEIDKMLEQEGLSRGLSIDSYVYYAISRLDRFMPCNLPLLYTGNVWSFRGLIEFRPIQIIDWDDEGGLTVFVYKSATVPSVFTLRPWDVLQLSPSDHEKNALDVKVMSLENYCKTFKR